MTENWSGDLVPTNDLQQAARFTEHIGSLDSTLRRGSPGGTLAAVAAEELEL